MERPQNGLPEDLREHTRLMCDIIAMAFQTDKTRVASLLLARDLSSLYYPFLDVREGHHGASHDDLSDGYERISRFHLSQLAYLAQKLDAMPEGDGTVLDHSCLLWLSNMWAGWKHDNMKVPVVTAGGLGGTLETGRSLEYLYAGDDNRKLCSLYLSIMDRMGVTLDRFGDASTRLAGLLSDSGRARTRSAFCLYVVLSLVGGGLVVAQKPSDTLPPGKSPHLGNKASIRSGLTLYRVRCGDCHGLDARGYRGPDLTAVLGGMPDERLFQTIRKGVPGTEMPPSTAPDDDVLMIIAYLRDMNAGGPTEPVAGNVENGAKLFAGQCASCHRVGTRGGRLGPDLSRVGAARSRAALVREIRTPSEWIPPGYETVTLVTSDGQKIRGVKKNEDVFSIQVMDTRERIQGYRRSALREVTYEPIIADAGVRSRAAE